MEVFALVVYKINYWFNDTALDTRGRVSVKMEKFFTTSIIGIYIMRLLLAVVLWVCSFSVYAKEGVVVHFSIENEKPSENNIVTTRYISGILVQMNGFTSLDFDKRYNLRVYSKSSDEKNINLVITLNEFEGDKLYYVGEKVIDLVIGDSQKFEIVGFNNKISYKFILNTSYGKLPEVAAAGQ